MDKIKIGIVCAPGVGDALIFQIAFHQLRLAGFEAFLVTPHRFGRWFPQAKYGEIEEADTLLLQHDNTERSEQIKRSGKTVYTFYGSHHLRKHGPLKKGVDYVCHPEETMVTNLVWALKALFQIPATSDNGFSPPSSLFHRRYKKRVVLHATASCPNRMWPLEKFERVAAWLKKEGFEPLFLPQFPTLEELISFIYESGYFIGNDSGPGHIASCAHIPHLIIGKSLRHMLLWRPGWLRGEMALPPSWIPNWKGWRLREEKWKKFITTNQVINTFKTKVLRN